MVWVDLLTRREFEAGFGSHTPMFSGQTKCVRYFMNFARALALAKECLLKVRTRARVVGRVGRMGSASLQQRARCCTTGARPSASS